MLRLTLLAAAAALAILSSLLIGSAGAQSSKGGYASSRPNSPVSSPVAQLRQQQQQNYAPAAPSAATKRQPPAQQSYQQQQQQTSYQQEAATEDPLADSEPALYGSVAGQPGVDFPAYARIPKTSFTCEGKGFNFGFYADEEAQCQVYHVCWEGRRESFLCGVGTVFNQAILACDYWHSVDCSKSSQFYGVNSELGKSSAEPASGPQRQPARSPVAVGAANFGDTLGKRNPQPPVQQVQQQQQQYSVSEDANFEPPVQQQQQTAAEVPQSPAQVGAYRAPPQQQQHSQPSFGSQRSQPTQSYEYQQRLVHTSDARTKTANQAPRPQPVVSQPPPPPPAQQQVATKQRPRFNMDFNQKVNSLIESPIRAPLKSAASLAGKQRSPTQPSRQPNFAQLAVSRAQQAGSQQLNAGPARKGSYNQQQTYDSEADEPPQQQQQNFDDSPVQTSTVQTTPAAAAYGAPATQQRQSAKSGGFVPQQTVVQAGNGLDGASAITTQYDTLTPAGVPAQSSASPQSGSSSSDQSNYESSLDESNSSANDDFRSAGAKAAASHNQNWYIMRSI